MARSSSEVKLRLPRERLVWGILGFLFLMLVAYFVRATVLTGSPFMYYQPLILSEDSKWAIDVVEKAELYRPWVGAFVNVPQLYPVSVFVGYFVCAQLSVFLFLSVWKGLSGRDLVISLVNLTLIGAVLSWILVFRMLEPRHIFWVTPFLAISYVYGIQQFSNRFAKGNHSILQLLLSIAIASTAPLMLVANLYVYGDSNGYLRVIPGCLEWFSNYDGWFLGGNLLKVLAYLLVVTGVMVIAAHLGAIIKDPRRLSVVVRWANLALLGLFLLVLCIPTVMAIQRYDSAEEREHFYDGLDYGMARIMTQIDEQGIGEGTVLCFWGWGVEYLSQLRFGYIQLGEPVEHIAGMRDILQSADSAEITQSLDDLDVKYALFPSERNSKGDFLKRLGGAASADLLVNFDSYFEPTGVTSGPDGWTLYRRRD